MKKTTASQDTRKTNPVAKNTIKFNTAKIFKGRKKAEKHGYSRFKKDSRDEEKTIFIQIVFLSFCTI